MQSNDTLLELRLSGNHITDVTPLAEGLKTNTTLTNLSLANNEITDVSALITALEVNKTLIKLDVSGNLVPTAMKAELRAVGKDRLLISV